MRGTFRGIVVSVTREDARPKEDGSGVWPATLRVRFHQPSENRWALTDVTANAPVELEAVLVPLREYDVAMEVDRNKSGGATFKVLNARPAPVANGKTGKPTEAAEV